MIHAAALATPTIAAAAPAAWQAWAAFAIVLAGAGYVLYRRARRRTDTTSTVDERFKLALWASGELFWEYDPVQQHAYYLSIQSGEASAGDLTVLGPFDVTPQIPEPDRLLIREALLRHLRGETPMYECTHRIDLNGTGDYSWVRARGRVVQRDAEGRALRLAGTARDITAEREALRAQRIATEVMRSMNEAVAVLDGEWRFVAVNGAFTRITGYTEEEVAGRPMSLLDGHRHDPADIRQRQADLQRDGFWSGESWEVRKDGEDILCRIDANPVPDPDGRQLYHVLVLEDITERKRAEQELRYLANYDTLTGLPNRSLLSERLSRAIVRARRENGRVAVLFMDIDRFKDINDSLGHATGDRILRAAGARVQQVVGAQHTVARLSGDEFTVVLEDVGSMQEAQAVAQRILEAFATPLSFGERLELAVSASIGISLYPDHGQVPTDLLKHADTAMYQAKAVGRRTWRVYSEAMDERDRRHAILASGLRRALEREELSLVYQPRKSMGTRRIVSAEALLRWDSHEFGEVSPCQFIALAEETGLIVDIGAWAMRQACLTLRGWHDAGLKDMRVSVNVSALQLQRGDLDTLVARVLADTGVDARHLELELTESIIMANPEENADTLRACRALGVSLAIDDFGTGYSSLAYLKRLPIDTLKIAREFVGDLTRDPDDEAITAAVIAMGHSLSKRVVAEGVEHAGQVAFLREHGCDEIQGHYVARALPADQLLSFAQDFNAHADLRATR